MRTTILVTLGSLLVAVTLRDVGHALLHPGGSGALSRGVMQGLWRILAPVGRRREGVLAVTGPIIFVSVLLTWTVLLATGWALLYWPALPDGFRFASPLDPGAHDGFDDALYLSVVTLSTLGYGDVTPTAGWLRVAAPLEALVGFALLTAGISSVLSLYPVLARRRALAHRVAIARKAAAASHSALPLSPREAARWLAQATDDLALVHAELLQNPMTYYFHDPGEPLALPAALPSLAAWSDAALQSSGADVRFYGAALGRAVDDLLAHVGDTYLGHRERGRAALLRAYARDHGRAPAPSTDDGGEHRAV